MALFFHRIATLILKNLRDEITPAEQEELQVWVNDSPENAELFSELSDEDSLRKALQEYYESEEKVWNKITAGIEQTREVPVRRMRPWRYVAAASVTILVAAGVFWWFNDNNKDLIAKTPTPVAVTLDDIKAPLGNNSTLTLSDGSVINLDSSVNGTLAREGNASVIKKEGIVEYASAANVGNENAVPSYNMLRTKRGGQQELLLPCGSRVILNAESSIEYLPYFAGNDRKVRVTGEAHFSVKSHYREDGSSKVPFIVEIMTASGENKGQVEVLGTEFSINAYDDEEIVKTTLVEGKVRMTNSVINNVQTAILKPGQQAQLAVTGNMKIVKDADVEAAIGWTKNEFVFHSVDIETILRSVCRWYPISASFPNGAPKDKYNGTISRNVNLSTLLQIFKESDLKFRLEEGNKLIVIP